MSKKINILMPCEEANHTCDKTQYNDASLWEKIKLNIHLLYCRACRKYTKNNTKLSKLVRNKKVDCLETSEKKQMNDSFEQELAKHQ